ncbi:rhodanese-like domain protein [Candidatus Endolissoclinum faulkneri L2]|uniref:Sulfurtransferase n=1 Tax=Candidatus Endolissoclinum faulkneri L2 TaxID=1193729 RepID=K7YPX0_9PROT|nr:3-mercaptopyruvate sulfurtransferase [Candidatus Endolissoclinum faulkneri]AFX99592.1 rhodanese-like domain protein [Candidatus Endolissoclinum faulkneri L2]
MTDAFVTAKWLANNLNNSNVIVLDCTYHMPSLKRDAKAEFLDSHIPGAQHFDIDTICDLNNSLPHMIPSVKIFSKEVSKLSINNDKIVVVYDTYGMYSAARAWWMFRLFGHDKVAVLDGGLPKWQAEGYLVETGSIKNRSLANFNAIFRCGLVKSCDEVLAAVNAGDANIIDARPFARFTGEEIEPRQGMRSGHIPSSISIPSSEFFDKKTMLSIDANKLAMIFDNACIDLSKPIIASCGSGVTACNVAISAFRLGYPDVAIYDGSWSEWGSRQDTPVETGPGKIRGA